jgi:hypothetical protein
MAGLLSGEPSSRQPFRGMDMSEQPLLSIGSLRDVIPRRGEEGLISTLDVSVELPGVTLASYKILDAKEFWFGKMAEVYLFGVAVDASASVKAISFGQAELDKNENITLIRKVREGKKVSVPW